MKRSFHLGIATITLLAGFAAPAVLFEIAASAASPTYSLQPSGVATKITLAGTSLVGGTSSASAGSTGAAQAQGTGELSPLAAPVTGATTVHTGEPWAGPLPIVLLGLAILSGLALVARRRLSSALRPARRHAPGAVSPMGGPPPGPASGTSSVPPPVPEPARRTSQ